MPTEPNFLTTLSATGLQSATLAALIFFGRRFIAQHEALIKRLDDVLAESIRARESMDAARTAFEQPPRTRNKRHAATILFACACLVPTGCSTVADSWLAADRATYDAIAPTHRAYVEADTTLTARERALIMAVLDTWRIRIAAATNVEGEVSTDGR